METSQALGLAHLWAQSDSLIRSVALLLAAMSVASWTLIGLRVLRQLRARHHEEAVDAFWTAPDLAGGLANLAGRAPDSPFEALARSGAAAAEHLRRPGHPNSLVGRLDADEVVTRALRKSIVQSTARLESGLTVLASIGSTAPFVGLFGTVWGIYHALVGISAGGAASLEQVAGPVGEALIMTAAGLAVAIPAVLAYNLFGKWVAGCEAELEGFAHDLREMALENERGA